jgi:hypothetical protein
LGYILWYCALFLCCGVPMMCCAICFTSYSCRVRHEPFQHEEIDQELARIEANVAAFSAYQSDQRRKLLIRTLKDHILVSRQDTPLDAITLPPIVNLIILFYTHLDYQCIPLGAKANRRRCGRTKKWDCLHTAKPGLPDLFNKVRSGRCCCTIYQQRLPSYVSSRVYYGLVSDGKHIPVSVLSTVVRPRDGGNLQARTCRG